MTARFITVEGIEGAGKTTSIAFITRYLEARGIDLVVTREPGGTGLGEELRAMLLAHRHGLTSALAREAMAPNITKPAMLRSDQPKMGF